MKKILVITDSRIRPLNQKEIEESIKKRNRDLEIVFSNPEEFNSSNIITDEISLVVFFKIPVDKIDEFWEKIIAKYIDDNNYLFPLFINIDKREQENYRRQIVRLRRIELVGLFA